MNDLKSPSYWIGHLLATVATIIGVYYAAIVGFELAIKVELLKGDRSTYFLSESIYKELSFNVKNLDNYIEKIKTKKYVFKEHISGIKLNDYIFEASKFTDSTFEIEPKLLSEVSIFYFTVGNAVKKYYEGGEKSPQSLMKVIKKEVSLIKKQNTLNRLSSYNKVLSKSVENRGMSVSQVEFEEK